MGDEFKHILGNVQHMLKDLEAMVLKYRSLATLEKRTWDRLRFGLKGLNTIRQKLTYHTAQMELFLGSLTVGALGRIEDLLKDLVLEVRNGRRSPTILSIDLSAEEGAVGWNQLQSDLSEGGIALKDIDRHRDDILEYMSTLTTDPETQSDDAIMSSDFGEDGRGLDSIFNDQVPEDSWDSISQRMATNQNTETFERVPENLQRQNIISTAAVGNNVLDPNSKLPQGLIEVNEKEIRSEVRQTRSKISENIVNRYQYETMPTPIRTTETPMKHADPSDKGVDRVLPLVTPSQFLKENGFDIDSNPSGLPEALKWAARAGHVDVVRLLLARKPQITRQNGYQDLMEAVVISGKDEILRLLIDNNVDMNLPGDDGWTALFCAAVHEHVSMVEMLLSPSSGVIINQKDFHGCTALHFAAGLINYGITKMLIQSGADVNSLDDQGSSPLHEAAEMGRKANARVLLNANANIEAIDEEGITPLRRAFENGHDDVVRLLLKKGANTRSAYVGPLTPRYPHTSKQGFEAARQAILWWEEENRMKSQITKGPANEIPEPEIPAKGGILKIERSLSVHANLRLLCLKIMPMRR